MRFLLIGLILVYKRLLRPALHFIAGPGRFCRFEPSCSAYCLDAIRTHGAARGAILGIKRVLRCHPWGGRGYDPVPPARHRTARTA